jgi:hypothetical protein
MRSPAHTAIFAFTPMGGGIALSAISLADPNLTRAHLQRVHLFLLGPKIVKLITIFSGSKPPYEPQGELLRQCDRREHVPHFQARTGPLAEPSTPRGGQGGHRLVHHDVLQQPAAPCAFVRGLLEGTLENSRCPCGAPMPRHFRALKCLKIKRSGNRNFRFES